MTTPTRKMTAPKRAPATGDRAAPRVGSGASDQSAVRRGAGSDCEAGDAEMIEACRERRAPRHERGRRRVDAILDAAGAIIAEEGMGGLTVDAIVKRSGTSKSSMYHFFPDLNDVVEALIQRHCANISKHDEFLHDTVDWAALTTEQAVDRFLEPSLRYIREHPDFLQMVQAGGARMEEAKRAAGLDALHIARAERMIDARAPGAKPAQRRARAATWCAVIFGVFQMSIRASPALRAGMMRELRVVLVGLLTALESSAKEG